MRIVLINGSHRKGNTQFMLDTIRQEIQKKNSDKVSLINLCEKNIGFCNEQDYNCNKTIDCQNCCRDDMKEIYPLLQEADIIIFGSPIYFSNVSARMKNLMDRCNPYYFNDKLKGKYMSIVGVGESENNKQFFDILRTFGSTLGMKVADVFYTTGQGPNIVEKNPNTIEQLKEFTKLFLVSGSKSMKKTKA